MDFRLSEAMHALQQTIDGFVARLPCIALAHSLGPVTGMPA